MGKRIIKGIDVKIHQIKKVVGNKVYYNFLKLFGSDHMTQLMEGEKCEFYGMLKNHADDMSEELLENS